MAITCRADSKSAVLWAWGFESLLWHQASGETAGEAGFLVQIQVLISDLVAIRNWAMSNAISFEAA